MQIQTICILKILREGPCQKPCRWDIFPKTAIHFVLVVAKESENQQKMLTLNDLLKGYKTDTKQSCGQDKYLNDCMK